MLFRTLTITLITIAQCLTASSSSNLTRRSQARFDPHTQRIDVTGRHKFVPPGHGDLRGPCPGLNALANHNYLPHNGIGTMDQFISANRDVYGMGLDMAIFLAILGSVISGDGTSFSIGGPPPPSTVLLPPLLGHPLGLSGSHNKYETDGSTTRGDLYLTGDNTRLNLTLFKALYDKHPDHYDIPLLNHFRYERFRDSIHHNPYFFNGVISGVGVQPAGYIFPQRFMANRSLEYPDGIVNRRTLRSFFGVDEDLVYREGWERIPDDWYKRAVGDDYDLASYVLDVLDAALEYPIFLSVGGNTGTVDSFTGVSIEDLTGGVLNAEMLVEGDNLLCFLVEAVVQAVTPDVVKGVGGDVVGRFNG
ncbi:hypothetical protein PM082_019480 [Marasmius tenuissimus]|nr:hypothetical protein PM082_019480 [Marasmius tenuissimus]